MVLNIDKKRSIGDAAKEIGVQAYVIRFWETKFADYIKPTVGVGGRRYFFDKDIKILNFIKDNLYNKGYTIKGLLSLLQNEVVELNDYNTSESIDIKFKENETVKQNQNIENMNDVKNLNSNVINKDMKVLRDKLNNFYDKLKNV